MSNCPTHSKPCLGVCLMPTCQQPQRLLCFECVLSQLHAGHNSLILDFQTLERIDKDFLFMQTLSDTMQRERAVSSVQEVTEHLLDELFDGLRSRILDQLEQTKVQMKAKLHVIKATYETHNKQKTSMANQQMTFLVQKLKTLAQNLVSSQVSVNHFNNDITTLLNNAIHHEPLRVTHFDQEMFKLLSKTILEGIQNLNNLLSNSYQHIIQFSSDSSLVALSEDRVFGTQQIKFQCGKPGVVYSDSTIGFGVYQLRLRVDRPMEGHICIGLLPDTMKWSLQNCCPNFNLNGVAGSLKNVRKQRGGWCSKGIKAGDVLVIDIDLHRGLFSVHDEKGFESIETQFIKGTNSMRIYLYDYDGRNNEFTLLRCGRIA